MKKALRETQTLCAGCSKAEPNFFVPPQTPFLGALDSQNLISWRWSLPLPTDPVWWGSMHAISSYRGNRSTHTPTHKQTGPITIHRTTRHQNVSILDFIAARDERGGGDDWSYTVCKIPVKSSLPINQYSAFYRPNVYLPFLLPDQQCQSTEKLKRSRTDINSTELWKLYGRFS